MNSATRAGASAARLAESRAASTSRHACAAAVASAGAYQRGACPASQISGQATLRRSASTFPGADEKLPDYYRLLGVPRNATADEIKSAFREAAKRHHPDVAAAKRASRGLDAHTSQSEVDAAHAADVDMFKLVNEAYSVLSDGPLRREYDANRFSRASLLRRRNEGWDGSASSDVTVREGGEYRPYTSASKGDVTGEGAGLGPEDASEAFRQSMLRVNARYQEGLKGRASMARVNRKQVRYARLVDDREAHAGVEWPLRDVHGHYQAGLCTTGVTPFPQLALSFPPSSSSYFSLRSRCQPSKSPRCPCWHPQR